jgi:hypothetical protein
MSIKKISSYNQMKIELESLQAPDHIKSAILNNQASSDCTVDITDEGCVTESGDPGRKATMSCKNPDGSTSTRTWCTTAKK